MGFNNNRLHTKFLTPPVPDKNAIASGTYLSSTLHNIFGSVVSGHTAINH